MSRDIKGGAGRVHRYYGYRFVEERMDSNKNN